MKDTEIRKLIEDIDARREPKTRITITIDEKLDEKLKNNNVINVSKACNDFLWYYIKQQEKNKNKKDRGETIEA